MTTHHLAQANIAVSRYSMDAPEMLGFTGRLDEINSLADGSPGFVWRATGDDVDAAARAAFDEPRLLFNLTLWDSFDALNDYVYRSAHAEVLRQRAQWFDRGDRAGFVLWWIPAGSLPTIDDTRRRFESLWTQGPTADAFTFRHPFDPPELVT
ncbi:MAG: DUF3291 domain-containing protein [Pseudomonadota bacterium]